MNELESPRRVAAMRGWHWIADGMRLVGKKPITFIVFFLTIWIALIAATQNQLLMVAVQVFLPSMLAGGFKICQAVDEGKSTPVQLLTVGFRGRTIELIVIGGLYFLSNVIVLLTTIAFGGQELLDAMANRTPVTPEMREELQSRMLSTTLVSMIFILPLQMALWFAPTSIALTATSVGKALRHSLLAVLRNWLPFLVYGAVMFVFAFVLFNVLFAIGLPAANSMFATISLLVPTMVPTIYTSYKDLLVEGGLPRP